MNSITFLGYGNVFRDQIIFFPSFFCLSERLVCMCMCVEHSIQMISFFVFLLNSIRLAPLLLESLNLKSSWSMFWFAFFFNFDILSSFTGFVERMALEIFLIELRFKWIYYIRSINIEGLQNPRATVNHIGFL